jgi:nucleotide-binding universal stress UspA family protein
MVMYRNILVTLDSCGQSEPVLDKLQPLVWKPGITVNLLSVYPPMRAIVGQHAVVYGHQLEAEASTKALRYLEKVATQLQEHGAHVHVNVQFGDPVEMILGTVQTAAVDLIVLPIPWYRGDGRLMTVEATTRVIQQASVPVLVVRLQTSQSYAGGRRWNSRP